MIEPRKKTAILISGRGSNMKALIEAAKDSRYPADIALVISNKADAAGLAYAQQAGIETLVIDHRGYDTRADFEAEIHRALKRHAIELVCLAGFMRVLSSWLVTRWRGRMINIHPSLLPALKGLDTHARALALAIKIHGCTVHFVETDVDSGPILMQGAVPVLPGDTVEALAARVLRMEHIIYPRALAHVARATSPASAYQKSDKINCFGIVVGAGGDEIIALADE